MEAWGKGEEGIKRKKEEVLRRAARTRQERKGWEKGVERKARTGAEWNGRSLGE